MQFFNQRGTLRPVLLLGIALSLTGTACGQLVDVKHLPREGGLSDLVILDPGMGTSDDGAPAVLFNEETQQIEIPPVLHVHRYYYSGDKEYQGPLLAGGPTIVVAQHPATGEQVYVDVMLPAGAPEIAYTKHSITYVYKDKRVVIAFSHLLKDHVKVAVIHGRGARRTLTAKAQGVMADIKKKTGQSRLVTSLKEATDTNVTRVKGAFGMSHQFASFAVEKSSELVRVLPGVQMLESAGASFEEEGAQEEIRRAGLEQAQEATTFVETIR